MRGLFIHIVVFAVVNALLVGAWLLTTGSTTELSNVQADPLFSVKHGFWPLVIGAIWGGALVIHAGVWMGSLLPGGKKTRARREARMEVYKKLHQRERERQRERRDRHGRPRPPAPPAPPTPGAPWPSAGARGFAGEHVRSERNARMLGHG